ncbi:makorin, ring finger protein, 4 isoform X3 [Phycodurus eques]|uniref:makorin, ring finger protein, 4 isoform X3 n=1 Tax=Phycodurus eques TaxID=693459 RepID=UPI002ACEDCB9|nr:makorin, ring finger protein, 4 isoform X3 [Phycodurus eques]XP_061549236.1 makorin, ring finger protein, 4 isoform X3 [Phycodurus eques]
MARDAIIDTNCPPHNHPKFVATSRKVHAGMVNTAGTSMSPNLKVVQMLQAEDCLYQRSHPPHFRPPPPLRPEVQLTEEVQRLLLLHRLMCCQGGNAGHRGLWKTLQTSQMLGTRMLRSDYKMLLPECLPRAQNSVVQVYVEKSLPGSAQAAGAAAAPCTDRTSEAYLQSRDVTCGICMDKVYEKMDRSKRVFGILPNCSHAFCLQCIMTWRKTRDLGPDVVKTCPQCRVRSAFYVPHQYWVEGQAKESLIADFKEKFSKRSCSYYARYKPCPFETECLYRHDRSARRRSFLCNTDDDDDDDDYDDDEDYDGLLNFFIAMTLLRSDDDDDDDDDGDNVDIPFFLAEYGF